MWPVPANRVSSSLPSIPTVLRPSMVLQVGDVILAVGEKAVSNPNDVRQDVAELRKSGKHTVLMRIKSGEATTFVALPLGRT